jgi:chemotaxis protein MotB
VSVVNEGKFRVMSKSMSDAFNGTSHVIAPLGPTNVAPHSLAPPLSQSGTLGKVIRAPISSPIAMIHPPLPTTHAADMGRPGMPRAGAGAHNGTGSGSLNHIEGLVRLALQPLIDKNMIVVRRKEDWLEIEIRTDILFPSGVALLTAPSDQVLENLATILAPFTNPLRVEGFTDNVPIATTQYPSNWELSAARAASVARLFASAGVDPARLGIVGWGEVRPLADNATVEGRNSNRRVLVVVMSDGAAPARVESAADNVTNAPGVTVAPTPQALPTAHVTGHTLLPAAASATGPGASVSPPAPTAAKPGLPVVPTILALPAATPVASPVVLPTSHAPASLSPSPASHVAPTNPTTPGPSIR